MQHINVGDTVYFLWDYSWIRAQVIKINKKTAKLMIDWPAGGKEERNVRYERIARENEKVCVVWEMWRGVNGRGGSRIEREMYPKNRIVAQNVSRSVAGVHGRINEEFSPFRHRFDVNDIFKDDRREG